MCYSVKMSPPPLVSLSSLLNAVSFCLLAVAVLCRMSRTFKFYWKSFVLYAIIMLDSCLVVPYGLLHFGDHDRISKFAASTGLWLAGVLGAEFRVEVEDEAVLDKVRISTRVNLELRYKIQCPCRIGHMSSWATTNRRWTPSP